MFTDVPDVVEGFTGWGKGLPCGVACGPSATVVCLLPWDGPDEEQWTWEQEEEREQKRREKERRKREEEERKEAIRKQRVRKKRRRSNVAVIIIRVIFIRSFFFYCLLCNHSFQTNPNSVTNCFKLFSLLQLYNYIAPASLFDF